MSQDTSRQAIKSDKSEIASDDELSQSYRLYGGILLFLAVCTACVSGYWFYKSIEYRRGVTVLQKESEQFERKGGLGPLGALPGLDATMNEMTTTAAFASTLTVLVAEKRAYQFLSLAMFLGLIGYAMFNHRSPSDTANASASEQ